VDVLELRLAMQAPLTDEQIRERDGWRCARCAYTGNLHIHHRFARSGGKNETAANRVALCAQCHRWAHGHPEQARREGWIVRAESDPADVPVMHRMWPAGPILLLDDGSIQIVIQSDTVDHEW
jgi:hypothetical protein